MENCKVSVIIPSYNRFEALLNAVGSVKAQTFKNHELLVINDGSEDERYRKFDWGMNGVRYFETEGKGVCATRNTGIKNATGEYLAFLDDDDSWLPNKLEKQVSMIGDFGMSSSDGFYSETEKVFSGNQNHIRYFEKRYKWVMDDLVQGKESVVLTKEMVSSRNLIATSSVMLKKELALKCEGFKMEEKYRCEDWPLWLRCLEHTGCVHINIPLFFYNNTPRERLALKRGI